MAPKRVWSILLIGALMLKSVQALGENVLYLDMSRSEILADIGVVNSLGFIDVKHRIKAQDASGALGFDPKTGAPNSIRMLVQAASFQETLKIPDDQRVAYEESLRRDILKVRTYPEVQFISQALETSFINGNRRDVQAVGDLTVRGVRRHIQFPVHIEQLENGWKVTGELALRPEDYRIKTDEGEAGTAPPSTPVKISFNLLFKTP